MAGCRRQAYSELYYEQMASEIRALEDRIYEYDAEYRALEDELLIAQQELERVKQSDNSARSGSSTSGLFGNGGSPKNQPTRPDIDIDLDSPPSVIIPGADDTSDGGNASPTLNPPIGNPTKQSERSLVSPPSLGNEQPKGRTMKASAPPSIAENDSIGSSRIPLPVSTSVQQALHTQANSSSQPNSESKKSPQDRRVVEIAFHAPLCRGKNFDEGNEDDGIYLVLQPKNQAGEVISEIGNLTIIAAEPKNEGEEPRFARWEISAAQASESMQLTGTAQGIHLSLPFQDTRPSGDRIVVYVRMELPNGRRVINEHTLFVKNRSDRSLWLPRSASASANQ